MHQTKWRLVKKKKFQKLKQWSGRRRRNYFRR